MMTRRLLLLFLTLPAWAQLRPIEWVRPVQDKNFFLLSLLERDAKAKAALLADPVLRRIGDAKREALSKAAAVLPLLEGPMRSSGLFQRYHPLAPGEMLTRACCAS